MDKESFYLESNCDGLKIYVTTYIPKGKIKGIVQFSHGMAEHQTYYYDFMDDSKLQFLILRFDELILKMSLTWIGFTDEEIKDYPFVY